MHGGKLMGLYQFNPVAISRCQFLMILDALVEVGKVLLVNGKVAKGLNRTAGDRRGACIRYSRRVDLIALRSKSTRLNSSHGSISYAVFCLKKKKDKHET